ncbi:MAG: phosphonate ABC transporter, permease protein PhnE [Acidiferrobacterales bacterium]|nr:phosphonate ABC transporter, permease protein PhnE [Acidiferrobacterales bacterium]
MTTAESFALQLSREEKKRRIYGVLIAMGCFYLLFKAFVIAEDMNSGSFIKGMSQFLDYPADILKDTVAPDANWFAKFRSYIPAMIETINMAAIGTLIGGIFAVLFAFVSTRNIQVWPPLIPVARRMMDTMRAFPELIIALFLIFVLGTSPVPAIVAIILHTTGALGKLFSEVNENIDRGPLEGLQSTGANWLQRMRFGVLPQVSSNYLSYALLRFEINIRASAILGFVGAGGIGTELRKAIGWSQGADISALFVLLFLTIIVIDQLSSVLRRKIIGQDLKTGKLT